MDRPGHYVYVRDNEDGDYWSISWQPVGKPLDEAEYICRHGLSYSSYECRYHKIWAKQTLSVPIGDALELWDVVIKNEDTKPRDLSLFSYCEFSFHHINIDNQNFQMSLYCSGSSYEDGVIAYDLFYEEFGYQYFTSNLEPDGFDCLRDKFIGSYRTEDNPQAVECGHCGGSYELGNNHCGALQKNIRLMPGEETRIYDTLPAFARVGMGDCHRILGRIPVSQADPAAHFDKRCELGNNHCGALQKNIRLMPGEETRILFLLGEGNREEGKKARKKYSDWANVDKVYQDLKEYWDAKLGKPHHMLINRALSSIRISHRFIRQSRLSGFLYILNNSSHQP